MGLMREILLLLLIGTYFNMKKSKLRLLPKKLYKLLHFALRKSGHMLARKEVVDLTWSINRLVDQCKSGSSVYFYVFRVLILGYFDVSM